MDHVCELRQENDDLKGLLQSVEESRRVTETKHSDLHKENRSLQQNMTELQEEVGQTQVNSQQWYHQHWAMQKWA